MAGTGPAPQETRRRRNAPARGDWAASPGIGWQHGEIPRPPARMSARSRRVWRTWMTSWFASHWGPEDLPMLELVILLHDKVAADKAGPSERTELRQLSDNYGITKKGQQDRRWAAPKPAEPEPAEAPEPGVRHYGHLRAVPAAAGE